ncbi:DNA repair protein RecN [Nakamurella sp. YIM 132087]|uniref:DNA repair protein RecN n=1 Tax=Nakamurella alba TaxID=2665158 RepID=A0A7K1FR50_9ACTN|nr:DNA repair protein RecN [Nakamurella alba]MTD16616.1 DNA repair protein RecN [Nakamurella alba]
MLSELRISGLGVIDDAVLLPHPGLTAVTGETGAGKTMVVTALGLITGGRADSGRVRTGADRAVVEARVEVAPDHTAAQVVESAGGHPDDDGSFILIRTVTADGRSRAHAGGRSVPLSTLTEITDPVVAVHGQSEAISLLQAGRQRAVLDRYAQSDTLLERYRTARAQWQAATAELQDRTAHARERAQREQLLRMGVGEIDAVAPQPGEDVELVAAIKRLENADALRAAAADARGLLSGDAVEDVNAVQLLETARKQLESTGEARLVEWATSLHQAAAVLVDVGFELSSYLDELDADPAALEQMLARQATLRSLTRRYGADVDAVLAWRAEADRELELLDSSDEALAALQQKVQDTAERTATAATVLSAHRAKAAARLGGKATDELEHLAMGRATLRVAVTPRPATADAEHALLVDGQWCHAGSGGIDAVEFLLRSHSGAPELPIAKGASGGELSRVMLAVEVVLADADPVGTLVFDEVDAGVGGRAATEIGRRLAQLARTHQVIVVTHLAQVAAFADRHVVVDAAEDGAVRISSLREVIAEDREAELARMLGGTDGSTARAHAAELLESADLPAPVAEKATVQARRAPRKKAAAH